MTRNEHMHDRDSDVARDVSIIIPALNEEVHLASCLKSIAAQRVSAHGRITETIVVDNQSTDGTVAVAERNHARVVEVVPNCPSRARNAGARVARGECLAFIDADCELSPNWLERCARHFQDPDVVAVGAAMRPPAANATWVERCWFHIAHGCAPSSAKTVHWLPGFNLLVRRATFEDVGGFDEGLVTCEDSDLGYRLTAAGRLVFEPETTVAHHGESRTLSQLFRREAWRSQGNLQLAFSRLSDVRNWVSVLLPAVSMAGLVGVLLCGAAAMLYSGAFIWGVVAGLALFLLPFAAVAVRLARQSAIVMLPRTMVVMGAYLAARTTGLFVSTGRVPRTPK